MVNPSNVAAATQVKHNMLPLWQMKRRGGCMLHFLIHRSSTGLRLAASQVTLDRSIVGFPALIGMTDFSHIWLVFVFHDNTNAVVNGVVEERPAASASAAAGAGNGGHDDEGGKGEAEEPAAREEGDAEGGRAGGNEDEEKTRWGGGPREYQAPKHKLRQTFLTKVW